MPTNAAAGAADFQCPHASGRSAAHHAESQGPRINGTCGHRHYRYVLTPTSAPDARKRKRARTVAHARDPNPPHARRHAHGESPASCPRAGRGSRCGTPRESVWPGGRVSHTPTLADGPRAPAGAPASRVQIRCAHTTALTAVPRARTASSCMGRRSSAQQRLRDDGTAQRPMAPRAHGESCACVMRARRRRHARSCPLPPRAPASRALTRRAAGAGATRSRRGARPCRRSSATAPLSPAH